MIPTVNIRVDTGRVIHKMRGGIGASWHVIHGPIASHAGSAWGGNPPVEDEAGWAELFRHAEWLGLSWMRVELEQKSYEPERDRFTWDSPDMRALYRILDWCEARDVDVFLQQMWSNVAWNAHPGLPPHRSAPVDLEAFAEGLAELVAHLRRYRCLRWLCINNEPGWDWSWWQDAAGKPLSITPGLKAVRAALDRRGLALPLSGPDWTGLPALEPARMDFDEYVGAYDLHTYYETFGHAKVGESATEKIMRAWADWAHARGRPFFLSEIGAMNFGWRGRHIGPGTYFAGLKNVEIILRGLNAGVDGFSRWSFTNRGDLDGQWQLVDTWDIDRQCLRETFTPHPNSYVLYALVSRFIPKYSEVLPVTVDLQDNEQYVVAAATRSPSGRRTLVLLNNTEQPVTARVAGLHATLRRYRVTEAERNRADARLEPQVEVAGDFADDLPGYSVSTYVEER